MATPVSDGGPPRKKRPWRKQREAIGPGYISAAVVQTTQPPDLSPASDHVRDVDSTQLQTPAVPHPMQTSTTQPPDLSPASDHVDSTQLQTPAVPHPMQTSTTTAQPPNLSTKAAQEPASDHMQIPPPVKTIALDPTLPVDIDGSIMEGGGQILRNAVAVSCLLTRPIHITRIRAGRSKPGLAAQHLTGIQLISDLCGGSLEGDSLGSTEISFRPRAIRSGNFLANTGTAGSICLLLQAALPCLLFAPTHSQITLRGGTNADMAPPIDYLTHVFQPTAEKFGVNFECQLKRRGFYPRGGGEVIVTPHPVKTLSPVCITDPGQVTSVKIHSFVAGAVHTKVLRQMVHGARQVIERRLDGMSVEVNEVQEPPAKAFKNGSGIIAIAETTTGCIFAGSANGRKNEHPDKTGKNAGEELVRSVEAGGCVDEHMQDQLIILMALAKGKSTVRTGPVTLHTQTAIHVAELMTQAKFTIQKLEGQRDVHLIECNGIGLQNMNL